MKFYFSCFLIIGSLFFQYVQAQESTKKNKAIEGLDFGVLPSFTYNTDRGLQYGALASLYYYNESAKYPDYVYSLYLQSTRTTRKGYSNLLYFDSNRLFSQKIRLIVDMAFRRNGYHQFYGFNGYNSDYQSNYEEPSKKDFISLHYYNLHKTTYTVSTDVHVKLPFRYFKFDVGIGYYNIKIHPFFRNRIGINPLTLFEKYINNGIVPVEQKNGGITTYLKTGLIFDSRDNEAIPTKGIWVEAIYCKAPLFLNNRQAYSQVAIIYRQYFNLKPVVFAYRLAYQNLLSGQMPFYMLPYLLSTYRTDESIGGVKTIRGVFNQRLQGNGYALANFEFRYIFLNTILLERNLGIALNTFSDMGIVTNQYKIDPTLNYAAFDYQPNKENMHYSVGAGIRFIVDHNFIVSFDCGQPLSKKDGKTGFYIDLDYLF